jgi:hypothetical protein
MNPNFKHAQASADHISTVHKGKEVGAQGRPDSPVASPSDQPTAATHAASRTPPANLPHGGTPDTDSDGY